MDDVRHDHPNPIRAAPPGTNDRGGRSFFGWSCGPGRAALDGCGARAGRLSWWGRTRLGPTLLESAFLERPPPMIGRAARVLPYALAFFSSLCIMIVELVA